MVVQAQHTQAEQLGQNVAEPGPAKHRDLAARRAHDLLEDRQLLRVKRGYTPCR